MEELKELFNELPLPENVKLIKELLIDERDAIKRYVAVLSPTARHRALPELRKIREALQQLNKEYTV